MQEPSSNLMLLTCAALTLLLLCVNNVPCLPASRAGLRAPSLSYSQRQQKTREAKPRICGGGVLNGNTLRRVKPVYPAEAKAKGVEGAVVVMIRVDEEGNVYEAQACSGPALLLGSAEEAARQEKFRPTLVSGKAVRVGGVLVYRFRLDEGEGRLSG